MKPYKKSNGDYMSNIPTLGADQQVQSNRPDNRQEAGSGTYIIAIIVFFATVYFAMPYFEKNKIDFTVSSAPSLEDCSEYRKQVEVKNCQLDFYVMRKADLLEMQSEAKKRIDLAEDHEELVEVYKEIGVYELEIVRVSNIIDEIRDDYRFYSSISQKAQQDGVASLKID